MYRGGGNLSSFPQSSGNHLSSGDIILSNSHPQKSNRKAILYIIAAVLIIVAVVFGILAVTKRKDQESQATDYGHLYSYMQEIYSRMDDIHGFFIAARNGEIDPDNAFDEDTASVMTELREKLSSYYSTIMGIKVNELSPQTLREKVELLQNTFGHNIIIYNNTFSLYDAYYLDTPDEPGENLVQKIFSAYTDDEEFLDTKYYELIGNIIAELSYEE